MPSNLRGERVLHDDGYQFVVPVEPPHSAYDSQGHLNNAAVSVLFNDLRVSYMRMHHPEFSQLLAEQGYVVAVREMHTLFESQGMPGERFLGASRIEGRRGRAQITEQRIVETSAGRPVARAWLAHLLVRDGKVVDWPGDYWERVSEVEGRPMPAWPRPASEPFGPPPPGG